MATTVRTCILCCLAITALEESALCGAMGKCPGLDANVREVEFTGQLRAYIEYLACTFDFPISIEHTPVWAGGDFATPGQFGCEGGLRVGILEDRVTLREALDFLTSQVATEYTWSDWRCKIVNVYPKHVERNPDYVMNTEMPQLTFRNATFQEVNRRLSDVLRASGQHFDCTIIGGLEKSTNPACYRTKPITPEGEISAVIGPTTLRVVLNELITRFGRKYSWKLAPGYISHPSEVVARLPAGLNHQATLQNSCAPVVQRSCHNIDTAWTCHQPAQGVRVKSEELVTKCKFPTRKVDLKIEAKEIGDAVKALSSAYGIPIHFESHTRHCSRKALCHNRVSISLRGTLTLLDALGALVDQTDRYSFRAWNCRAINVFPAYEARMSTYTMNLILPQPTPGRVTLRSRFLDLQRFLAGHYRSVSTNRFERTLLSTCGNRRMALPGNERKSMSVRDYLNRMAEACGGGTTWQYSSSVVMPFENPDEQERLKEMLYGAVLKNELVLVPGI